MVKKPETVGSRLKELRDLKGYSKAKLGREADVSVGSISRYEDLGAELPDRDDTRRNIRNIAEALGASYTWILSGDGAMYDREVDTEESLSKDRQIAEPTVEYDTFELRIHHKIKAGASTKGHLNYEADVAESETHAYSRQLFKQLLGFSPPPNLEGVYVTGHSMEPGLTNDQLVLYKPVSDIVSGKRYVVHLYDPMTADWYTRVKRLERIVGGGLRIISDNPRLADTICTLNEQNQLVNEETGRTVDIRIIGRVLWPREDTDASQIDYLVRAINHYIDKQ